MKPMRWLLVGFLVIARALPSDAGEQKVPEDPQVTRFERLLKRHPDDPKLHYNLGTARYQQGHYDKAEESLSTAVASSDTSLQRRASYNLGNAHYRLGRAAERTAPSQAADFYQKALADYRFAIRQDPKDLDAKYNYELAERRLKALKSQTASAQQAQGEQAKQEQSQQAEAQQQQSGQSQPQQTAPVGSESEPVSPAQAAQEAEQQKQGEQAQVAQPPLGQQGPEQKASAAADLQNMSQQQALWILDTLRNEERGAVVKEHPGLAHETDVDQDW